MQVLEGLIERYVWVGNSIGTYPPAIEPCMAVVLRVLNIICRVVDDKLKIDTSNIHKYIGIKKVLDDYYRGSECVHASILQIAIG